MTLKNDWKLHDTVMPEHMNNIAVEVESLQNQINQHTNEINDLTNKVVDIDDNYLDKRTGGVISGHVTLDGSKRHYQIMADGATHDVLKINGPNATTEVGTTNFRTTILASDDPKWADGANEYEIWNNRNVPIEEGQFTPTARGTTSGSLTTKDAIGRYYRVGKMVNFHLELYIIGVGGAQGNFMISGLPFVSASGVGKSLSIGIIGGMPTGNTFTPFMSGGSSNITIQQKNVTTGAIGWLTAAGATSNPPDVNGNRITISGTYTIN